MATGAIITGVGEVAWIFTCNNKDQSSTIITQYFHVPKMSTRLLSPQKLFNKQNG